MTFKEFSEANRKRCVEGFGEPLNETSQYTPSHWALAMVEEVGEVAAAVMGVSGLKKRKSHLTVKDVGDEIADVLCYADLLAARLGLDLGTILASKFNRVSDRIGSPIKLPDLPVCGDLECKIHPTEGEIICAGCKHPMGSHHRIIGCQHLTAIYEDGTLVRHDKCGCKLHTTEGEIAR